MTEKYDLDQINGRLVPPLVITSDYTIIDTHSGTVHVEAGVLELRGLLRGTLVIHSNAGAVIYGTQQGTVSLDEGATSTVHGAIQGTVAIAPGATVVVEETGRLAGALTNNGTVVLRGIFGGPQSGRGDMRIEGRGHIKQPTIRDGISYYEW